MIKLDINLIPNTVNPSPDYYCTWQTQLYATNGGTPDKQRKIICENSLFNTEKPYGWAYFYDNVRSDLFLVMDDSWDVPLNGDESFYGSLILNNEKFPTCTAEKSNAEALKALCEKIEKIGWKGLGGWVCAQESANCTVAPEEYWRERLEDMHKAGFKYWKVDWGRKCVEFDFRKMLTSLARQYAPNLCVEHAVIKEIIPCADTFRTYDVPAIMSIPMTLEKIANLADVAVPTGEYTSLINCEDEVYIAAAGGFAMGIMRHPFVGSFPNGKPDLSFPSIHRDLKTKMLEIVRAVRWHKIAPAFAFCGETLQISDSKLTDNWKFVNKYDEIENWWFKVDSVSDFIKDDVLTKTAPAAISRNTSLPEIEPDQNGDIPFCVCAKNPNGAFSVATLGRTAERKYFIPNCNVTINAEDSKIFGIFGEYRNLTIKTNHSNIKQVLMQDLAADNAFDITAKVKINNNEIVISGEVITEITTKTQDDFDTSEPGVVVKILL